MFLGLLGSLAFHAAAQPARPIAPVLAFPEAGIDDSAAYPGYRTRFFRDALGNTVQVYVDARAGRVVTLLADADDESVGFSTRDAAGAPVGVRWNGPGAVVARGARARSGSATRIFAYDLIADARTVALGRFVLGSMRVERDVQYAGAHRAPLDAPPYRVAEHERLIAALAALPAEARARHLALLDAPTVAALRMRLQPTVSLERTADAIVARVVQPALDARDTLVVQIIVDPRRVTARVDGDALTLTATSGAAVPFTVRVTTGARALTPLARTELFTPEFLAFVAGEHAGPDAATPRVRRLERQVRAVELLASREKLMAGLPNYATYFGRDMMVTALMMRPIWRDDVSAFVVASALRKLAPDGQVSHEEALGGQAVREAAGEYAALAAARDSALGRGDAAAADTLLARATRVLADARRVRENYHMIDDELQLAVLASRWLADPRVPAARKRAFLADSSDGGGTRLARLLTELGLVARMTAPYAADAVATNLIAFAPRDSSWASASWRDSGAGYAGGRYAMDVNAIWAPHALEGMARVLATVRALGLWTPALERAVPALARDEPLGRYARDSVALTRAIATWRGAARHFVVALDGPTVRDSARARVAALPAAERAAFALPTGAPGDSLTFLALALDAGGRPIGVANTDPATALFLGASEWPSGPADAATRAEVLRDVAPFVRAYPAGLLVDGVGPVVANDAYASRAVQVAFERDPYHGPRVVWGREVNLFLLGIAGRIAAAGDTAGDPGRAAYVRSLDQAAARVRAAVDASGFHSELWTYAIVGGRPVAERYATGSDLQLWSTTDLAVAYAARAARRPPPGRDRKDR